MRMEKENRLNRAREKRELTPEKNEEKEHENADTKAQPREEESSKADAAREL